MHGLDLLGVETVAPPTEGRSGRRWAVAALAAGGATGVMLWRKHPVLGVLNGMALGGNVARAISKDITPRRAAENLGAHAVATAASLALPAAPWLGWIAGAVGSNLFIDREDSIIERIDETMLGNVDLIGDGAPTLDDVRAKRAVIKQGMSGDAVRYVQAIVGVVATGNFDAATMAAVELFQHKNGLKVDGVVGSDTLAVLDKIAGGKGGLMAFNFSETEAAMPVVPVTALVPRAAAPADAPPSGTPWTDATIAGRPAWQVVLLALGILLAGGGAVAWTVSK